MSLPVRPDLRTEPSARLAEWTTFRLGGRCGVLVHCATAEALVAAVQALRDEGTPYRLIGGGSNLLVADAGVPGVVVRYAGGTAPIRRLGEEVEVEGAVALDDLAAWCAREGLDGLRFAAGIPGTVGGAIVGNAGAFGEQVSDRLVSLELLGPDGRARRVAAGGIGFSYRDSALKGGDEAVAAATFRLAPGDRAALGAERERILAWRRERHPDWRVLPCAGSFFRNVEPSSSAGRRQAAGWFLEQAGAKGMRVGGARVYEKHANIIVKDSPDCAAADVLELSRRMAAAVRERFGIALVPEVVSLGAGSPGGSRGPEAPARRR